MVTVMKDAFTGWIEDEIRKRDMSLRDFATFTGISHGTLSLILNPKSKEDRYPKFDTLLKLARATNTDLCSVVALLAPDETRLNARVMILAERIANLSPEKQEVVDAYLLGLRIKPNEE